MSVECTSKGFLSFICTRKRRCIGHSVTIDCAILPSNFQSSWTSHSTIGRFQYSIPYACHDMARFSRDSSFQVLFEARDISSFAQGISSTNQQQRSWLSFGKVVHIHPASWSPHQDASTHWDIKPSLSIKSVKLLLEYSFRIISEKLTKVFTA